MQKCWSFDSEGRPEIATAVEELENRKVRQVESESDKKSQDLKRELEVHKAMIVQLREQIETSKKAVRRRGDNGDQQIVARIKGMIKDSRIYMMHKDEKLKKLVFEASQRSPRASMLKSYGYQKGNLKPGSDEAKLSKGISFEAGDMLFNEAFRELNACNFKQVKRIIKDFKDRCSWWEHDRENRRGMDSKQGVWRAMEQLDAFIANFLHE